MITRRPANHLLQTLPAEEWDNLRRLLARAELPRGKILTESEASIAQVFFPENCVVSAVSVFHSGATAEMATTGREGFAPIGVALGASQAIARHIVQVPGSSLVITKKQFQEARERLTVFGSLVTRYTHAFLGQLLQSVACNATHSAEERCARWLLMTQDRAGSPTFALTQEFLSEMLAVSRPRVSAIARKLKATGLISYSRGTISILDRDGLEKVSCECYELIRRMYDSRR
jgi:Crp-like helix-turn-helix domain